MRNRLMGLLLAATVISLALVTSPKAFSQQAVPRTPEGKPDLSGLWVRTSDTPGQTGGSDTFADEEPPMTAWARARHQAAREGVPNPEDQGREDMDPALWPYCMPPGFPRIYLRTGTNTFEFGQTPERLYQVFEVHSTGRAIYLDGREPLEGAPDMFMGNSVGRWDGDTLVVRTTGLNGLLTWLDSMGHPMTNDMRVEERIMRTDHDTLVIDFLFDDPKAYTRPWTGRKVYKLMPDWGLLEYTHCEERGRREYLQNVLQGDKGP